MPTEHGKVLTQMTENDLLEAVVSAARSAYTHPGVTQSITSPTEAEMQWASDLVQRVRQHDPRDQEVPDVTGPTKW